MSITPFDQLPPHDLAAERALIGSAMCADNALRRRLLASVTPDHFFSLDSRTIWAAIAGLAERGEAVDAVTVRAELIARGQLEDAGGSYELAMAIEGMPNATHGDYYAGIVLGHARRRTLCKIGNDTAAAAMDVTNDPIALAVAHRDRIDALIRRATLASNRDGGAGEVAAIIDAEAAGLRQCAPLPWPIMQRYTKLTLPAAIALLVGDPGAGKTFWLLECLNHWTRYDVPVAMLCLEKDRAWHLRRCLALLKGDLHLLDDESIRGRPEEYVDKPHLFADSLEAIGRNIWDATHADSSLDAIAAWIDQRASDGARVIVVDPVSLADTDEKPWVAHDRFMRTVRRSIEKAGATLVLVTHPRGGQKAGPPTIDDLAGSRVFVRRADSVLWLRRFGLRSAQCAPNFSSDAATHKAEADRAIAVLKCRDGSAAGATFALQWHCSAGGFIERGIVREWLSESASETTA